MAWQYALSEASPPRGFGLPAVVKMPPTSSRLPTSAMSLMSPLNAGGAKLVTTPLVAFLDSDTCPRQGWLDALLPHFQDPRVALVAPRIVAARHDGRLSQY